MNTMQAEQELKSERVQEENVLVAEEPFRIWLKAERVQEPAFAVLGAGVPLTSAFELTVNQKQPVTIELPAIQTIITLHGTAAGAGTGGFAQAPVLGEAG